MYCHGRGFTVGVAHKSRDTYSSLLNLSEQNKETQKQTHPTYTTHEQLTKKHNTNTSMQQHALVICAYIYIYDTTHANRCVYHILFIIIYIYIIQI